MGATPACQSEPSSPLRRECGGKTQTGQVEALSRNSVRRRTTTSLDAGNRSRCKNSFLKPASLAKSIGSRGKAYLGKAVDASQRIIVVGDIHGMAHKVKALWRVLEETLGERALLDALVVFLGDYCDRGPNTRELLCWLCWLRKTRDEQGARTVFLLGNHEFCLLAFLGLLPRPDVEADFQFDRTCSNVAAGRQERERWWKPTPAPAAQACEDSDSEVAAKADQASTADGGQDMHVQGRRWGGRCYERSYGSGATFAAYGTQMGDRDALLAAMPTEHLKFLQQCPWVHVEESKVLGQCIFVHAGLEADGSECCEAQLQRLLRKDTRQPQPEALFGRDSVLHTPPQLAHRGTTVVSGHHGRVNFRAHRIILDSCSGDEANPLAALVLPEMLVVRSDATFEPRDAKAVFSALSRAERDAIVAASRKAAFNSTRKGRTQQVLAGQPFPRGDTSPLDL